MSTQLILGGVFGVVGFVISGYDPAGAAQGFAIGYALGAPNIEGPKLSDLKIQNASVGAAIPLLYGMGRATGSLIWTTPLISHSSGGKGGGIVNYNYTVSCAVAIADGTILGVRRIWVNGKIWYAVPDIASENNLTIPVGGLWVGYDGTTWAPAIGIPGSYTPVGVSFKSVPAVTTTLNGSNTNMIVSVPVATVSLKGFFVQVLHQDPVSHVKTDVGGVINWEALAPGATSVGAIQADNAAQALLATIAHNTSQTTMSFHLGTETQVPDSFIQAYVGDTGTGKNFTTGTEVSSVYALGATTLYVSSPTPIVSSHSEGDSLPPNDPTVYATGTLISGDQISLSGDTATYTIVTGTNGPGSITITPGLQIAIAVRASVTIVGNNSSVETTPAYRGTAYVTIQNFATDISGNNIPNFEFEVLQGTTILGDIVTDICKRSGLTTSQIDVSQLTDTVSGYALTERMTGRGAITPLGAGYFFDAVETDNLIRFVKRSNGTVVATIPEDDLAAHEAGSAVPEQLHVVRTQELELPAEITLKFPNYNANYQIGSQYARKVTTKSDVKKTVQLPITMPDSQALAIVNTMLHAAWVGRDTFDFQVSRKYTLLDVTDLVLIKKGGMVYEVRLHTQEHAKPGILRFSGQRDDVDLYGNARNPLLDVVPPVINYQVDPGYVTAPLILTAPASATASGCELWITAVSNNPAWGGCDVYFSTDNLNFIAIGRIEDAAKGVLTSTLLSGFDPDVTNTLQVDLSESGTHLYSVTKADADALVSLSYVDGELISYETATLTGADKYDITYLRRGIYGSAVTTHVAGSVFFKVDHNVLKYPFLSKLIGQTVYFRFPSFNTYGQGRQSLAAVSSFTHVVGTAVGVPPNVTNLSVSQNGITVVAKWDALQDLNSFVYDFGYAALGTAAWNQFVIVSEAAKGTEITSAIIPPGTWTFGIRAKDAAGQLSPSITTYDMVVSNQNIVIDATSLVTRHVTLTNMIQHWTGVLYPDSQDLASAGGWGTFDTFVSNPYPVCSAEMDTLDASFDAVFRIWADLHSFTPPTSAGSAIPALYVDYKKAADAYLGYQPWAVGTITAEFVKFKVTLDTTLGVSCIDKFAPHIDTPGTILSGNNVTIAPGGTAITFATRYHLTPFVVTHTITPTIPAPRFGTVTNVSATGFTAHVYDITGTDVGGAVNWSSTGA